MTDAKLESRPRAWALSALLPVLLVSAGVAAYLGWVHIALTHGASAFESACNFGGSFDCDKVNTSKWSELFGLPISLWAVPLYLAMAWLAWVARGQGSRAHRAQGTLVLIAAWNVLVSVVLAYISLFVLEYVCLFCVGLYVLHAIALVLVLLPPGGRMPSLPGVRDMGLCAAVAVASLIALYPANGMLASSLDEAVIAELEQAAEQAGTADAGSGQEVSSRGLGSVKLPDKVVEIAPLPHSPVAGPEDAPVTVVVVSDFQCSYCRRLQGSMAGLEERYEGRVRWAFVHYPLDQACNPSMKRSMHPRACAASVAAQCAARQGRFWDYHDQLFLNQRHLEDADLRAHAERVGLDLAAFEACVASPEPLQEVERDVALARGLGIEGTPRTYINGVEFQGALPQRILDAGIRVALGDVEATDEGTVTAQEHVLEVEPLPPGPMPMVHLQHGEFEFWIDAVEASQDAGGRALALAGSQPANASWYQAKEACEAAGKRLCSAREWLTACRGQLATDDDGDGDYHDDYLEGRPYPYGDAYESRRCNDHLGREVGRARDAGAHSACVTPEGVYDLGGNLMEWVGQASEEAMAFGGAFFDAERSSCLQGFDTFGPGFRNIHSGYRCCADSPPEQEASLEAVAVVSDPIAVGESFPVLKGKSPVGRDVDSSEIQGRVAVVSTWASWCRPCQKQLVAFKALHEAYGDQRLALLVMGVDRDPDKGKTLRAKGLNFLYLQDSEAHVMAETGALAMPNTVLVDAEGRVVETWKGWNDEREEALKAKLGELIGAP